MTVGSLKTLTLAPESSSSKTTQIWRLFAEDVGLSYYWFVEDNSISCDRWFIKDTHPGTGVESVENCGTIGRGIPSFIFKVLHQSLPISQLPLVL